MDKSTPEIEQVLQLMGEITPGKEVNQEYQPSEEELVADDILGTMSPDESMVNSLPPEILKLLKELTPEAQQDVERMMYEEGYDIDSESYKPSMVHEFIQDAHKGNSDPTSFLMKALGENDGDLAAKIQQMTPEQAKVHVKDYHLSDGYPLGIVLDAFMRERSSANPEKPVSSPKK